MSQIVYTEEFLSDFARVYNFLNDKNLSVAQRFAKILNNKLELLTTIPKAFSFFGNHRLYTLVFGSSGYVILYDYDESTDKVIILRIKHQKEAGF